MPSFLTQLYVGTVAGCNLGLVTTKPDFRSCATKPIGWTVGQNSSSDRRGAGLFVGTGACNHDEATTAEKYKGCETRWIGWSLVQPNAASAALFSGKPPCLEAGQVVTDASPCRGRLIGFTLDR